MSEQREKSLELGGVVSDLMMFVPKKGGFKDHSGKLKCFWCDAHRGVSFLIGNQSNPLPFFSLETDPHPNFERSDARLGSCEFLLFDPWTHEQKG